MSLGQPCVLVIDDDRETRLAIGDTLRYAGYEVLDAGDGRSGLRSASDRRPDVVLLDLILPDTLGYEVLRQLRALPEGDRLPVVAISGFPEREDDAPAGGERFSAYLRKPFGEAELLAAVRGQLAPRV